MASLHGHCSKDEWEIIHNITSITKPDVQDNIEEDNVKFEQSLLEVLELENEKIANQILTQPLNKTIECIKSIPVGTIITNTPNSMILNILYLILKHNVALDWRVTLALSGVSVYMFISKYSYLYTYYSILRKAKSLLARK
jgi:hypothetical protein